MNNFNLLPSPQPNHNDKLIFILLTQIDGHHLDKKHLSISSKPGNAVTDQGKDCRNNDIYLSTMCYLPRMLMIEYKDKR